MKEETNETATSQIPSEAQMNDMHKQAWLDFQTDAQKAKQEVNRRYALVLNTYKTYKNVPYGVKESVKQDYDTYKEKWGENGTEQQKRFGVKEPDRPKEEPSFEYKSLIEEKEAFLNKVQHTREKSQTYHMEVER